MSGNQQQWQPRPPGGMPAQSSGPPGKLYRPFLRLDIPPQIRVFLTAIPLMETYFYPLQAALLLSEYHVVLIIGKLLC